MGKRQLYFHWIIVMAALMVGSWSIWEDGLIFQDKNYPNHSALGLTFISLSQLIQIYSYRKNYRKKFYENHLIPKNPSCHRFSSFVFFPFLLVTPNEDDKLLPDLCSNDHGGSLGAHHWIFERNLAPTIKRKIR